MAARFNSMIIYVHLHSFPRVDNSLNIIFPKLVSENVRKILISTCHFAVSVRQLLRHDCGTCSLNTYGRRCTLFKWRRTTITAEELKVNDFPVQVWGRP